MPVWRNPVLPVVGEPSHDLGYGRMGVVKAGRGKAATRQMLGLGYDPGGRGTHGVAAVRVGLDGALTELVAADVVQDAETAWKWMSAQADAVTLGINILLAWSPRGGRGCDDRLRQAYVANQSV